MAEVRQAVEESADLVRTVEYLRERESELSKYSDKLRESVERIANVFGDRDECQICEETEGNKQHHFYFARFDNGSFDELPKEYRNHVVQLVKSDENIGQWGDPDRNITYFEETENPHKFVPKIEISVDAEGEEFTTSAGFEGTERAALCLRKHVVKLKSYIAGSADLPWYTNLKNLPRETLKRVVKERRITELIEIVKQKLDETTKEYKQVSGIAEKLASAL